MPVASGPITVLIADDSPINRRAMRMLFADDPGFLVIGEAVDGQQAVELTASLRPHLVTMDVDMPVMNGLDAIARIMAETPTRILVITSMPRFGGLDVSFEALSRGALELVPRPQLWPESSPDRAEILKLARRLASVPVVPHIRSLKEQRRVAQEPKARDPRGRRAVALLAVGASTGGPHVIRQMLSGLTADTTPPMLIVQHLSEPFVPGFIDWLARGVGLRVTEAVSGSRIAAGTVLVGARGGHVTVTPAGLVRELDAPPRGGHRPSIDVLFDSVAEAYGARAAGLLLTGMGSDGAAGLKSLARAGGVTMVQDESSCAVFGMPKAALELYPGHRSVSGGDLASIAADLSVPNVAGVRA